MEPILSRIRKAVFPVGGLGTRFLPATKAMPKEMLAVVDKPLIQYAVEEALAAGIEEFIFVTGKGKTSIEDHFDHSPELEATLKERGHFVELEQLETLLPSAWQIAYTRQLKPLGLGHAVWSARNLVGDEPFAVFLADDLIVSGRPCMSEMVEAYEKAQGNYVAIMEVEDKETSKYGIIDPVPGFETGPLVAIQGMVEKPKDNPPSNMAIIGRYILTPQVFEILSTQEPGAGNEIQLTDALKELLDVQPFYGYRFSGQRFDCGSKIGMLKASLHVALQRPEMAGELREEMIRLLELERELKKCA
jgi:UTP--glucose-1-phosphate uridylyltransferase